MAAGERLVGAPLLLSVLLSSVDNASGYHAPQWTRTGHHDIHSRLDSPTVLSRPSRAFSSGTSLGCQLLGMNSRDGGLELNLRYVWPSFCERGGQTDVHADGWGLAYYHEGGHGLRQFHDVEAASTSSLARFLTAPTSRIRTTNMMAHIRFATTGVVDLANVHPFSREMWGLNFAFCHNGHVPLMVDHPNYILGLNEGTPSQPASRSAAAQHHHPDRFYSPVGTTDSEALFCAMLNALRSRFVDSMPSLPVLHSCLRQLVQEVVEYDPSGTILNFLLTTGPHVLWVYSWPGQRPGSKTWNGLHYVVKNNTKSSVVLSDDDYRLDVRSIHADGRSSSAPNGAAAADDEDDGDDIDSTDDEESPYCIVATKPLTGDPDWVELQPGELILMDNGLPHVSVRELFRVELQGHGLDNQGRAQIRPPRLEEDLRRYESQPDFFAAGGI